MIYRVVMLMLKLTAAYGVLYGIITIVPVMQGKPWCTYTPWYIATEQQAVSYAIDYLVTQEPEKLKCVANSKTDLTEFQLAPAVSNNIASCHPPTRTYSIGRGHQNFSVVFRDTRGGRGLRAKVNFDLCGSVEYASCNVSWCTK